MTYDSKHNTFEYIRWYVKIGSKKGQKRKNILTKKSEIVNRMGTKDYFDSISNIKYLGH